jgi:hypothetical protein
MEDRCQHKHDVYDLASYHEHRRLNEAQQRIVHAKHAAGIGAARTKASLKANDSDLEISKEMRQGMEPNQALVDELTVSKYKKEIIFGMRRIEKIFIADAR